MQKGLAHHPMLWAMASEKKKGISEPLLNLSESIVTGDPNFLVP